MLTSQGSQVQSLPRPPFFSAINCFCAVRHRSRLSGRREYARRVIREPFHPDGGGAEGDRTPDLCNAIAALSQLSYGPVPVYDARFRRNRRLCKREFRPQGYIYSRT